MNLKEKANKLGFISKIKLVHENLKSPDMGELDKMLYYLWLCELQKWLREKHDIHIEINSFSDVSTYDGNLIYNTAPYDYNDPNAIPDAKNCKTYEKALEICLYKGIKLIK